MIKEKLYNFILFNYPAKKIASFLLASNIFTNNYIYKKIYFQKIQSVIAKYKENPHCLRIENTNICNAKCIMCPRDIMTRKQGIMSQSLFEQLIDEAQKIGIKQINLHNFGEPLIDPNFIKKLDYLTGKNFQKISTNTNASLLTSEIADQIAHSCLDEIYISLDAATDKTYSQIRKGLDYSTVEKNILYLIKKRNQENNKTPKVILDFLVSDLNKNEISLFKKNWYKKADHLCISSLHDWTGKTENSNQFYKKPNYRFPCRLLWTDLVINWDGTAVLCCQDFNNTVILSKFPQESLKNIWSGEKISFFRKKQILRNFDNLHLCKNCKLKAFWWEF